MFAIGFTFCLYQINSRNYNFNYSGKGSFQQCEIQSKKIQKEILGENLFSVMTLFDRSIPVCF